MENPNLKYGCFFTNSSPPTIDNNAYDDVYPLYYTLYENIDTKYLLIDNENRTITLINTNDNDYETNKFIASIIFLQSVNILKYLGRVDNQTLEKILTMISRFNTYYPYCVNPDKILAIARLILNKLKPSKELLTKLCNHIVYNIGYFRGVRFNLNMTLINLMDLNV